ncbi:MAG: DNA translocase FtsK 4TM domain-containing protein, partial [Candidatus Binatia bacterium]
MAVGRKPQPQVQERAFGDEVIAIACVALAIFFILAFSSYRANDDQANQMGLIGYVLADILRPMFGRMCYVLPGALFYTAAILLRLLPFPAPFAQSAAFCFFTLSSAALLALGNDGHSSVAEAGGWVGGFLAANLRAGLNRPGAYVALTPVILVSFMIMTRLSLRWATEICSNYIIELFSRAWEKLQGLPGFLPQFSWRRTIEVEGEPTLVKPRPQKKDSVVKKVLTPSPFPEEEEDEEASLPPIIISRPSLPPTSAKSSQQKTVAHKPPVESISGGKPYVMPSVSLLDPPVRLAVKVDEEALHASSRILESKLADFGVEGKVVAVRPGPVITTYEFEPAPGVKVSRVTSLVDDLQMALRAISVRILAPIRGQAVVGIEVSNPRREKVCL